MDLAARLKTAAELGTARRASGWWPAEPSGRSGRRIRFQPWADRLAAYVNESADFFGAGKGEAAMVEALILVLLFSSAVGIAIGGTKNRVVAGAILGLVAGPVGWLLVGLGPNLRLKCRECRSVVIEGAAKCRSCGADLCADAAILEEPPESFGFLALLVGIIVAIEVVGFLGAVGNWPSLSDRPRARSAAGAAVAEEDENLRLAYQARSDQDVDRQAKQAIADAHALFGRQLEKPPPPLDLEAPPPSQPAPAEAPPPPQRPEPLVKWTHGEPRSRPGASVLGSFSLKPLVEPVSQEEVAAWLAPRRGGLRWSLDQLGKVNQVLRQPNTDVPAACLVSQRVSDYLSGPIGLSFSPAPEGLEALKWVRKGAATCAPDSTVGAIIKFAEARAALGKLLAR
jgi:hypothetical protein